MTNKRKSAADVFLEQNIMQKEDDVMAKPIAQEMVGGMPNTETFGHLAASSAPSFQPAPAPAGAGYANFPPQQAQMAYQSQPPARAKSNSWVIGGGLKSSEELQLEKDPVRVRETGAWFWRRVVVPPNMYVVHTRMGRKDPVTLGLGVSFRYNPYTDAYLVVPAAMQTIGVVANCISKEKQGLNVLAYLQWQIDNFALAYKKLDFSDIRDPLGIVNAQLREQAEAAIKDKIATMSVEEVLTDKAPVIEELTTRLKAVSEGRSLGTAVTAEEGLGIKIVTVQIREAIVSSERLWQNLQAPFRHEQEKNARISYLSTQDEIKQKELQTQQEIETREAENMVIIERIKQSKQTEAVEIRLQEESTRFTKEQETSRRKIQLEEQTTVTKRESDQRLAAQAATIAQERELRELALNHDKRIEYARLENEVSNRQKSLQIEQSLHVLNEERRFEEAQLIAEQARLTRETELKKQESELNRLLQEQADLLRRQTLEAELARQQQAHEAKVALEVMSTKATIARLEEEVRLEQLRQEVRNSANERDVLRELIGQLPAIAEQMPEVHELKVLQTGGDAGFDSLAAFVSRMMALAESLGISLPKKE